MTETVEDKTEKLGIADLVYGILFNPTATFRQISEEPPLFYGFVIFVTVVVLTSIVSALVPVEISEVPPPLADIFVQAKPLLAIVGAIFTLIFWMVQAGVLHLFAELLGGRGRATGVLTALALADIPTVMVIPLQIISYFTTGTFLGSFLTVSSSLIMFFWVLALTVIGLREIHQLSTGRAVAALLAPMGMFLLIIIILTIIILGFAVNLVPQA